MSNRACSATASVMSAPTRSLSYPSRDAMQDPGAMTGTGGGASVGPASTETTGSGSTGSGTGDDAVTATGFPPPHARTKRSSKERFNRPPELRKRLLEARYFHFPTRG